MNPTSINAKSRGFADFATCLLPPAVHHLPFAGEQIHRERRI
ncbi:hypothetical protein ABZU76_46490 [Amycolatopsis sp. NPDC005232]